MAKDDDGDDDYDVDGDDDDDDSDDDNDEDFACSDSDDSEVKTTVKKKGSKPGRQKANTNKSATAKKCIIFHFLSFYCKKH